MRDTVAWIALALVLLAILVPLWVWWHSRDEDVATWLWQQRRGHRGRWRRR